jgi:type II secretory pathway pseudopilin PulG
MLHMARFITYLLVFSFIFQPQYVAAEGPQKRKAHFALVKLLTNELTKNSGDYFDKEELSRKAGMIDRSITNEAINDTRKKLKDDSYSLTDIKQQIQSQLIQEEQNRLIELKYILSNAPSDKLDFLFKQALRDGLYSADFEMSYRSAYNHLEKAEVLMQMLQSDLSLIRTQNAKQMGLMTREDLLKQLEETGTFFNYKNDKVLAVVIIVLTVAAAGFITWGVVSATKNRHERKKQELNQDFDRKEQEARNQHASRVKTLEETFAERERLREEGYVWQVCSTTKSPKTASCSYDYRTHAGEEVCVTRCLRNSATGDETLHAKTCLSAFIPNNCFQKNPAAAGYDDGYSSGWDSGYSVGYDRGYEDAYWPAYNRAYSSAYYRGYDSGYNAGFSRGYSDGVADYSSNKSILLFQDEFNFGYKKGFQEGYSYALQLKVGSL